MLGLQTKNLRFLSQEGIQNAYEEPVFFFGDNTIARPHTNLVDVDRNNLKRIKEYTNLNSALHKILHTGKALDLNVDAKENHILNQKKRFMMWLIDELAELYLVFISRLYWIDNLVEKRPAVNRAAPDRWQHSGLSLDTCIDLCKDITNELTAYFNTMVELRFDPGVMSDKLALDKEDVINKAKEKVGYMKKTQEKKSNKKKSKNEN